MSPEISVVSQAISVVVIGVIWWDIRTIRKDNNLTNKNNRKEIARLVDVCHKCQVSLPKEYATLHIVDHLTDRVDEHGTRISRLEGAQSNS